MQFIVEDGTGVAGANAYITEDYLWAYAPFSATAPGGGDPKAAIVRATAWIEARYGYRFPGTRKYGREQGLSFPRYNAVDRDGYAIDDDMVPGEVQRAVAEAALREIASAGSLMPDQTDGAAVKREKLGSMEVEYAVADSRRAAAPVFPMIDGILAPLIGSGSTSFITLLRA